MRESLSALVTKGDPREGHEMEMYRRYPLSVEGDFYVMDDMCLACTAPEDEAPDLMSFDPKGAAGYHCYFKRQPVTPEELDRAIMAVAVGCCGAVRYAGSNPAIIRRLSDLGVSDMCDQAIGKNS